MNETNYGNFAEPKENFCSRRGEDVLLTALKRCEELEERLNRACIIVGEKELEIINLKEEIEILRRRIDNLKKI